MKTGELCTAEEANTWDYAKRTTLIREDPVTCVRYYHHRILSFVRNIYEKNKAILGGLNDWMVRNEAQTRGVMHGHGIGWSENAPVFDADNPASYQAVADYADKHVTCSATSVPWDLLQLQVHSHNRFCKRKDGSCRGSFPRPPMPRTTVMLPLDHKLLSEQELQILQEAHTLSHFCHSSTFLKKSTCVQSH